MIVQALNQLALQGPRCRDFLQQIGIHFQVLSLHDNIGRPTDIGVSIAACVHCSECNYSTEAGLTLYETAELLQSFGYH